MRKIAGWTESGASGFCLGKNGLHFQKTLLKVLIIPDLTGRNYDRGGHRPERAGHRHQVSVNRGHVKPQWRRGSGAVQSRLFAVDWTGFASLRVSSGFLRLFAERSPSMPLHSAVESGLSVGRFVIEAARSSVALRAAAGLP